MQNKSAWLMALLLTLVIVPSVASPTISVSAQNASVGDHFQVPQQTGTPGGKLIAVSDYKHDVSSPLRDVPPARIPPRPDHEANPPASTGIQHSDASDPVVQGSLAPLAMPAPALNFDGIPFPGVACNCAPQNKIVAIALWATQCA